MRCRAARAFARCLNDGISGGSQLLGIEIDDLEIGPQPVGDCRPCREGVGEGLDAAFDVGALLGRSGAGLHRIREVFVFGEEQRIRHVGGLDALLRFVSPHHEQRDQKFPGVVVAEPNDPLVDDALDCDAGVVELTAQTVSFRKAQFALISGQRSKIGLRFP